MGRGYITLGQVAARAAALDVACSRCDRRGRLGTARLLERHGPGQSMTGLRAILAGDCPRLQARGHGPDAQCGAHSPQLVALFR